MHETKIISVLRKFSADEMKEFGWFVDSPFFNRVKKVSGLFEAIKKFHPDFESRFLNKQYVYRRVTKSKTYNDAVMRNLCSDLFKLSEKFLGIKAYLNRTNYTRMQELVELRKTQPEKTLITEFEKVKQSIENAAYRDTDYYYDTFTYWKERNNNFSHKSVEAFKVGIEKEISGFSNYFVMHLIDRFHHANRFKTSYKTSIKHNFLTDTVGVLEKYGYMDLPVAQVLYNMYMVSETNEEGYYLKLKELLKDNFKYLSPYTRFTIFQSLQTFFMNCERRGIKQYRRDRFEMYRDYAKRKEMIYQNLLSDASYTSAVVAACQVGEFEWALKFTEEYKKYLDHNLRQDAYYYNYARILHAQKRNEEALGYLAKVIPTHHPIKAVVKVVELQILFELENWDAIYHKLDSFRHFVSKNEQMSQTMRDALGSFFKLYGMLIDSKTKENGPTPLQIKKEIERRKYSYAMEWIIEKQLAINS